MPFDDLTTPTMQPVAWAVPDRDDGEIWHVTMWRDEAIRAAGGNAFALIPLYTLGCRLSGVAAGAEPATPALPSEFAAAADVAIAEEQRHDAATCCAERQEPDVGEGWRELGPDDVLQPGDEVDFGVYSTRWLKTARAGLRVGDIEDRDRYRRRVTVPPAPQSRTAETRASRSAWATPEEELAWFKKRVKWLDGEVERLRLRPEEQAAVRDAVGWFAAYGHPVALILESMLKRLGGGE